MLSEARRISKKLDTELLLIHAGEKNPQLESKMEDLLEKAGLEREEVKVVWKEGKTVDVLSQICKEEGVDLLILGAKQDENFLTYYLGSIARKLARKPPCSLLMLTDPKIDSNRLQSVVVNGIDHEKTAYTIETALDFAKHYKVNELFVVEEVSPSKVTTKIDDELSLQKAFEEKQRLRKEENKRVHRIIDKMEESSDLEVTTKCVFGKQGYSISHFSTVKNADLLVMNAPDRQNGFLQKIFPKNIEFVLSDMPCDLMIVEKTS